MRGLIVPDDKSEYEDLLALWYSGWRFQKTGLTDKIGHDEFLQGFPNGGIAFCAIQPAGRVDFFSPERQVKTGRYHDCLV